MRIPRPVPLVPARGNPGRASRLAPEKEEGWRLAEQYGGLELKKKELREEIRRLEREQEGWSRGFSATLRNTAFRSCPERPGTYRFRPNPTRSFRPRPPIPKVWPPWRGNLRQSRFGPRFQKLDPHLLFEGFEGRRWDEDTLLRLEPVIKRYLTMGTKTAIRFHRRRGKKRRLIRSARRQDAARRPTQGPAARPGAYAWR